VERAGTESPPAPVLFPFMKILARIRCWLRGYHVRGRGKFRYDVSGVCDDCGPVGTGKFSNDDGE